MPRPQDTPSSALLEVHVVREQEAVRVAPVGEVDIASVAELGETLEELPRAGVSRIVLDLRGLRFIDSQGVQLILAWDARTRDDGIELALIPGPPPVQRIFEIAGLDERLPFQAS